MKMSFNQYSASASNAVYKKKNIKHFQNAIV